MLAQIFVAILIVAVAFMVARDLVKTNTEDALGQPDASGYEIRPRVVSDTRGGRGGRAGASFRKPYGAGTPAPGYDAGPAHDRERTDMPPAGARSEEQRKRYVGSRLAWLAVIPAAAVAVVALCVVGLAAALSSTRINSSGSSVRSMAIVWAVVLGVVMIVVVVLAVRATIATARSVLRPLHAVRARALAMADGQLPGTAAAGTASQDEIGDIARALEQIRSRMPQPGGDEPGVRNKLDAMFVNLSHRGKALAERQMRLIAHLEQGEQDRERRASLFRMNSIAARMYRDAENLLVLAGHELSSSWNQPVALVNVIRAALAEIEEYERVTVHAQPEIAVSGPAVDDVAHLLAELIQNATSFSAVDMPVELSGQMLNTGGVLISITDRGVGMSAHEIAHANWRLENPPSTDIDVPKWIGLFVVARLAARRGVRVRLQTAEFGGLTALVWLPDELLVFQDAVVPAGHPGSGLGGSRRGSHETAMGPGGITAQRSAAMPRFTGTVPSAQGTQSTLPGRRPMPEEQRPPGSAWAAAGPRPAPQAAAGSGSVRHGVPGDQAGAGPHDTDQGDTVIVPADGGPAEERRLPIFDSVESHWFQGGRRTPASSRTAPNRWSSPADEGWQAARTVESPATGAPTAAGLPQRMPSANLVPGAIPGAPPAALPSRSPAEARDRLARLQRGVTEGRTAASEAAEQGGDDES